MIKFLKNIFTIFREEPLAEGRFECKMCRYEYPLEAESRHPQKGYCMGCFPNCNNLSCDGMVSEYGERGLCQSCTMKYRKEERESAEKDRIDQKCIEHALMDFQLAADEYCRSQKNKEEILNAKLSRLKILDSFAVHAHKDFFAYNVEIKERLRSFAEYSYDYAEAMMAERENRFEFYKNTNNQ